MQIKFTDHAWQDYLYWVAHDIEMIHKINHLIEQIRRDPFKGLGKPEPLKQNLTGFWSRRITHEHRLVYAVYGSKPNQIVEFHHMRHHYN